MTQHETRNTARLTLIFQSIVVFVQIAAMGTVLSTNAGPVSACLGLVGAVASLSKRREFTGRTAIAAYWLLMAAMVFLAFAGVWSFSGMRQQ